MDQKISSKNLGQNLETEDLQCLGECVRDLMMRLGYGTHADSLEALLFREVIDSAVYQLTLRQASRARFWEPRERKEFGPLEYLPIGMDDLAHLLIVRAYDSDRRSLSIPHLRARVRFALALDPACGGAYFLQGDLEEREKHYERAQVSYERAMQLAADKLGPEAFDEEKRRERQIHFWYSTNAQPYMQARAALAYLLWRKLGKLSEAIEHFQAMLQLNPGDNQSNCHALFCVLLEAGDDDALEAALKQHRFYTDEFGERTEIIKKN